MPAEAHSIINWAHAVLTVVGCPVESSRVESRQVEAKCGPSRLQVPVLHGCLPRGFTYAEIERTSTHEIFGGPSDLKLYSTDRIESSHIID